MTRNFDEAILDMRRLSRELHDGKIAPSSSEYEYYGGPNAPSRSAIYDHYGAWKNFVSACGLTVGSRAYHYAKAQERGASVWALRQEGKRSDEAKLDAMVAKTNAQAAEYRQALKEAFAPQGLACRVENKPVYNWRKRQYEEVNVMVLL